MHLLLRHPVRGAAIRRVIATLVAFAVMLGVAEPIFGEAHEREGARVALSASTTVAVDIAADRCTTSVGTVSASMKAGAGLPMHADDFGEDPHSAHVCHCLHVHGGVPVRAVALNDMWYDWAVAPVNADDLPTSVEREPGLRPPASALIG